MINSNSGSSGLAVPLEFWMLYPLLWSMAANKGICKYKNWGTSEKETGESH